MRGVADLLPCREAEHFLKATIFCHHEDDLDHDDHDVHDIDDDDDDDVDSMERQDVVNFHRLSPKYRRAFSLCFMVFQNVGDYHDDDDHHHHH